MEVQNRPEKEAALSLALSVVWTDKRRQLLRLAGDPPNVANVPESFWADLEHETREAIAGSILLVFLMQANSVQLGSAPTFAGQQLRARAAQFAVAQAQAVASNLVARGRSFLAQPVPAGQFAERVVAVLGPGAAERIAITETTRAATEAEIASVEDWERQTGARVEMVWRTEQDERVCPICQPLDGKPREYWTQFFAKGPPAHPNCRCALDIQPRGIPGRLFGN